ncbi:MAG TPA: EAL domain-containing protein, partial [Thermoanaerobaculia bacterium]
IECRPEYMKVSRYFIKGCAFDPLRRSTLEHFAHLAKNLGAQLIAEGVESISELDVVISLGIHLIQGFLFSQPASLGELARTDLLSLDRVQPVLPVTRH